MQGKFDLRPSRLLGAALSCMHAAAWLALLTLDIPVWALLALTLILSLSLHYYLRRIARLVAPASCLSLQLEGSRIILGERSGRQIAGRLLPGSLVTPMLLVINIRLLETGKIRSVVVMPDSLDAESFRQLRVFLNLGDFRPERRAV